MNSIKINSGVVILVLLLIVGCGGGGAGGSGTDTTGSTSGSGGSSGGNTVTSFVTTIDATSPKMDDGTPYASLGLVCIQSGSVKLTATSASYDPVLVIEQVNPDGTSQVIAEDDDGGGGSAAATVINVTSGNHYTLLATGASGSPSGAITLTYYSNILAPDGKSNTNYTKEPQVKIPRNTSYKQEPRLAGKKPRNISLPATTNQARPDLSARGVMGHNKRFGSIRLGDASKALSMPTGAKIWGNDVSQFQGSINWAQFASSASFAVIRTSYGAPDPGQTASQYADKKFQQNRSAAEAQGMEIGFYHYAYPEYNTADSEAKCFTDNIGSLRSGEFVVLDFEESWNGDVVGWCKRWLDDVQTTLGVRPLLYINLSTANSSSYNWSSIVNANYGLWLARWDFDRNANAPSTPWPFVAMRQYSDVESASGISGNVDGDVFYGNLNQLKAYGPGGGSPAIVSWSGTPANGVWYRSDEHLNYSVSGDLPNSVHEMIDSVTTATYSTSSGYIALSYGSPGWHNYQVMASNNSNSGNPSSTGSWAGGWDPNPPTVNLTGGASPGTWYYTPQTVTFTCSDSLSGIRQSHYQWDNGGFSNWSSSGTGTVNLTQGKHHLYVEAEDSSFTGTSPLGNRAIVDLGEFWLDLSVPSVSYAGSLSGSSQSPIALLTISNPNIGTAPGVTVNTVQLGAQFAPGMPWNVGDLAGQTAAKKSFAFTSGFGTNKALMLSSNVRISGTLTRHRCLLARPGQASSLKRKK